MGKCLFKHLIQLSHRYIENNDKSFEGEKCSESIVKDE